MKAITFQKQLVVVQSAIPALELRVLALEVSTTCGSPNGLSHLRAFRRGVPREALRLHGEYAKRVVASARAVQVAAADLLTWWNSVSVSFGQHGDIMSESVKLLQAENEGTFSFSWPRALPCRGSSSMSVQGSPSVCMVCARLGVCTVIDQSPGPVLFKPGQLPEKIASVDGYMVLSSKKHRGADCAALRSTASLFKRRHARSIWLSFFCTLHRCTLR